MRIFIISIVLLIALSCKNQTMREIYKNENIPLQIRGEINEIILYKGGNTSLSIIKKDGSIQEVAVASEIKDFAKTGDFFIKEKNTNKCKIIRKDSVICIDCYNIPIDIRKSLGKIKEWSKQQKGHWEKY